MQKFILFAKKIRQQVMYCKNSNAENIGFLCIFSEIIGIFQIRKHAQNLLKIHNCMISYNSEISPW